MVQDIGTFGVASRWGHVEGPVGDNGCCCGGANPRGRRSRVRGVAVVGDPRVNGQWDLPTDGQQNCPVAASRIARWRPGVLPAV